VPWARASRNVAHRAEGYPSGWSTFWTWRRIGLFLLRCGPIRDRSRADPTGSRAAWLEKSRLLDLRAGQARRGAKPGFIVGLKAFRFALTWPQSGILHRDDSQRKDRQGPALPATSTSFVLRRCWGLGLSWFRPSGEACWRVGQFALAVVLQAVFSDKHVSKTFGIAGAAGSRKSAELQEWALNPHCSGKGQGQLAGG